MNGNTLRRASVIGKADRLPPLWSRLSVTAALLAAAGSVIGLLGQEHIYGRETPDLYNAAIAQDLVNLILVAPLMVIVAASSTTAGDASSASSFVPGPVRKIIVP
jgi:hypothetical protein